MRRIDKCLVKTIQEINELEINGKPWKRTLASCCGHGVYHPTIFVKIIPTNFIHEHFSFLPYTPGKKRYPTFYVRDENGLFYNPVIEEAYEIQRKFKEMAKKNEKELRELFISHDQPER